MKTFWFLILIWSVSSIPAFAQGYDEEALLLSYGDEDFVSIATGRKQLISKAPAVASVITASDIRAMGASDIDDVLESVPGVHVSRSTKGYNPIYMIRGISTADNPQVLLLINGIPLTHIYIGDRSQVWGGMPVENISRIEVIRGPGSAVYGADAFAGTINIITKTVDEIDGVEVGAARASFNTSRAWVLAGKEFNNLDVAFSLQINDTDGHKEQVFADQQTFFDQLLGTSASLAPGPVNTERQAIDSRLDISSNKLRLRIGYQDRDIGTGSGVNQALDPVGKAQSKRFNADLTYHDPEAFEYWDVKAQLSYFDVATKTDLVLLPPGFAGVFPDGVIGNPDVYERHSRVDLSAFYTGFVDHDIRIGTGFYYQDLYRVEETKNFDVILVPGVGPVIAPLGGIVDVSDTAPYTQEKNREVSYVFIQDEWKFARDWSITAGVRYDNYSDFGDTVNPRFALIWQTSYSLTSKLLFARAFRAPSFAEQFNINNPVALGNDDLDPEIINTYELAFDYSPTPDLRLGLNIFHYRVEDIIRFNPTVADNTGDQTGNGLEVEMEWKITNDLDLTANYAFQDSEDKDTDSDAPNAPQHQVYARVDYAFQEHWSFNAQLNYVADRKRAAGDLRPEVDDYVTVDFTLRGKNMVPGWELALSVRNATDEEVFEPSLAPGFIPEDLPQAGRSAFVEVRKVW